VDIVSLSGFIFIIVGSFITVTPGIFANDLKDVLPLFVFLDKS